MHANMRYYSGAGAKELFDMLEARKAGVETAMRKTPNFVSYTLIRLGAGGVSITVCQDKPGTDESVRIAGAWVKENAAGITISPPMVSEGPVILHLR